MQSKARVQTFKVRLKKVGKHWSELVDTVRVVLFAVFQECDIGPLTNTHTRDVLFRKCFLQILHHVKYVLWKQCGTKPTLIPNAHSQAQVTLFECERALATATTTENKEASSFASNVKAHCVVSSTSYRRSSFARKSGEKNIC